MILSLFCGCGGLDLGFEAAGFKTGLAYDIRPQSVASWNANRRGKPRAFAKDITALTLEQMDSDFGREFQPTGVIGGPPCQSFTKANHYRDEEDARAKLVRRFFSVALELHRRSPLDFIVMENVHELRDALGGKLLQTEVKRLKRYGFSVTVDILNSVDFSVPQFRRRLFLVATRSADLGKWTTPSATGKRLFVRDAIHGLPAPTLFSRAGESRKTNAFHPNHWCMTPKSPRFFDGSLKAGASSGRSFKTLRWDAPSIAVSYGHREVHVHPSGTRRLSVYEAMKLQGFPSEYVLLGTLSAQIDQVSEAVPPPLARAVAAKVFTLTAAGKQRSAVQKVAKAARAEAA